MRITNVGLLHHSPEITGPAARAYKALQRIVHRAARLLYIAEWRLRLQNRFLSRDCDRRLALAARGWGAISLICRDSRIYRRPAGQLA
jgi:hypothetical protein